MTLDEAYEELLIEVEMRRKEYDPLMEAEAIHHDIAVLVGGLAKKVSDVDAKQIENKLYDWCLSNLTTAVEGMLESIDDSDERERIRSYRDVVVAIGATKNKK